MLIDYTYFFGHCEVGQLSGQAVKDKVNWFISQYEPKYLESLLGYATYKQLKADILLPSVPEKWSDLLYGSEYTSSYNGLLQKWKGLIRLPSGNPSILSGPNQIDIVVGRGGTYDPVADATTVAIPAGLVGQAFTFVMRGWGPLRDPNSASPEYSINNDGDELTLLSSVFNATDTYFYFGNSTAFTSASDLFKESPVAYYVYYWYQRNLATNTGGVGESKTEQQNASPASPAQKMVTAWNRMAEMNREVYDFLYSNKDTYADWYSWYPYWRGIGWGRYSNGLLNPINTLGL